MSMNVCLTYYVVCVSICVNNGCPSILVKNTLKLKNKTITMARVNLYANTRGLCTTWTCQQPVKAALMYPPLICSWVVFAEFSQVNLCYIAAKFLCPFVRFESCTGKKKQMIHE